MLKLLIVYMVLMSFSEIIGSVLVSLGKVVHQNIGKLIIAILPLPYLPDGTPILEIRPIPTPTITR